MATTPTPVLSNASLVFQIYDGSQLQTVGNIASATISDTREEINVTNLTSTLQETKGGARQVAVDLVLIATSATDAGYDELAAVYASATPRAFKITHADGNIAYDGESAGVCVVTRFDSEFPSPDSDVVRVNARIRINLIS